MKFIASIKWIPYCDGGRKKPPLKNTRYAPVIKWDYCMEDESWSIVFICPEAKNNEMIIEFEFISLEAPSNKLCRGMEFKLLEGNRCVAIGSVISVL